MCNILSPPSDSYFVVGCGVLMDRPRLRALVEFGYGPGELWGLREGGRDEWHPEGRQDHIAETHDESPLFRVTSYRGPFSLSFF